MRRLIAFTCEGETLVGALDETAGDVGVLVVSGGNELRIGAHRGMATLAAALAAKGVAVFRFDRRGIGDSTGSNGGYESAAPDIAAALAAFRQAAPRMTRVIGFGNCDAASALALFGDGLDGLVLANPWLEDSSDDLPAPAAIRARYAASLRDPRAWWRLLTGGVSVVKALKGLRKIATTNAQQSAPAECLARALAARCCPLTLLIARGDNTGAVFKAAWASLAFDAVRGKATVHECDTASHSFASASDKAWLLERIAAAAR